MARLSDFEYELPEERIAQVPLQDRSASKLLYMHRDSGEVEHRLFAEAPTILKSGDLLVLNDTRVSALRLLGRKLSGAHVEALLLSEREPGLYVALMSPGKRLRAGAIVEFDGLRARVEQELDSGKRLLRFDETPGLDERLSEVGLVPLPPYIHAPLDDPNRYQTVVANHPGSAAAPTAGLHFTHELLSTLRSNGVDTTTVTLDVGLDTFRPVQQENLDHHVMHGERCELPEETADKIASCKGRIVAVGTSTVRTLESFAIGRRRVEAGSRVSKLFIQPGFEFQVIDGMFTNFHLPKTTMLVMLSALCAREMVMAAYQTAIEHDYRFLSFGDSMLIL